MSDPTYTIAVCNYNMADTLERAVGSMLDLTDDRFEVLVVDDGSTDDSVAVLEGMQVESDRLRLHELDPDPERHLGRTRNISVREARGDYVLLQLDADDVYERGIQPFVELFQQLDAQLDREFYMKGQNVNMASREFLLEMGPYRNLPVGAEDLDFWRRLFATDGMLWLDHQLISHEIGDEPSLRDTIRRSYTVKVGEFQTGISLWSFLRKGVELGPTKFAWYLLVCPPAYVQSRFREQFDLPAAFRQKGHLHDVIERERRTLPEIERDLDVTVDRDALGDVGRELFYDVEPNR